MSCTSQEDSLSSSSHSNSTTSQFGSSPWLNSSTIPNPFLFSLRATGQSFTFSVQIWPKPRGCHCGRASGKWTWLARSQIITGANPTEKFRIETIQATVVSGTLLAGGKRGRAGCRDMALGRGAGFHFSLSTPNTLQFVWSLLQCKGGKAFLDNS